MFKKDNAEDKINYYNLNSFVLIEAQQKIENIHHSVCLNKKCSQNFSQSSPGSPTSVQLLWDTHMFTGNFIY